MAYLQTHLDASGSGWSARTACGRNMAQVSAPWPEFKNDPVPCQRCANSKLAALNLRRDLAQWEPEHPDAWKHADDALTANRNT